MRWYSFRRFVPWLVFFAVLAFALFFHRCSSKPVISIPEPQEISQPVIHSAQRETVALSIPESDTIKPVPTRAGDRPTGPTIPAAEATQPVHDSMPYVFADPWGGRHFDSITVALHCREDCVILYSFEDSINLRSYNAPLIIRRNTTLWFAGLTEHGNRSPATRLEYVIEKNPRNCSAGSMPVSVKGRAVCVDVYEWPNRENAQPRAMVTRDQAEDSCRSAGKHLCSEDEWQAACGGPEQSRYPYGENYDERYCPAQQAAPSRSGRSPACRSYYGLYDLTGNMWEWTSTPNPRHEDFYFVVGGAWDAADNATCSMAKYSFYPQNRYPTVGFRCCVEAK